jgi:hypothetical protein
MRPRNNQRWHNATSYWLTTDRISVSKWPNSFQCLIRQAICLLLVSHPTWPPVITSDENRRHLINKAYWFTGSLPTYVDFFCDRLFLATSGHSGSQEPGLREHLPYSQHPRVDLSSGVLTWGQVMLPPLAENYYFNWNVCAYQIFNSRGQ